MCRSIDSIHQVTPTDRTPPHRAFVACEPQVLRVALSSFYDMLAVALRALGEFDDDEEGRGR